MSVNTQVGVLSANPTPVDLSVTAAKIANATLTTSKVSTSDPLMPQGVVSPVNQGFKFWTYDHALCGSGAGQVLTGGTVYINRINTPGAAQACTSATVMVSTIGNTLTAGQNLLGVYNPSGTQLALSSDQAAAWVASVGMKTVSGLSFNTVADSFVWIVLLSVGTTPASFAVLKSVNQASMNQGLATGTYRSGTNVTAVTALPSPLVTGSNATFNGHMWAGIA